MRAKLVTLIVVCIVLAYGQSSAQLELKPAIGINITSFSKDLPTQETSAKVGWQLGGTISLGEESYLEGGIFWVYKSNEFTENSTDNKFSTELSGIRIPAMIGYHILGKEGGIAGLRIFGGGSVFILTNVKNPFGLPKSDFSTASYGLFAGAGVDISMFFLDAKYEWSLTDVSSATSFDVGKTKTLFINAGIRISL